MADFYNYCSIFSVEFDCALETVQKEDFVYDDSMLGSMG